MQVETFVAAVLLAGGLVSVAPLFGFAVQTDLRARDASYEAVLAEDKLQQLHGVPYTELTPLPEDAWMRSVTGAEEFLDEMGAVVGSAVPGPAAVYVRRWTVRPVPGHADAGRVLQVAVGRLRRAGAGTADLRSDQMTRLVALRVRDLP
jgi:hypothetical protein